MNKKSFILYRDQRNVFEALSAKDCKELLLAIFDFAEGEDKKLSPLVNIAFLAIKNQLKRDFAKWEHNSEMRKQFGRLGGLAKASKSYLKPVLLSKAAVNVNDNVNVNTYIPIWEMYVKKTNSKEKLTPGRKSKILTRLKTHDMVEIKKALDNCFASAFHTGNNKSGWKANFDWIFKSDETLDRLLNMEPSSPAGSLTDAQIRERIK